MKKVFSIIFCLLITFCISPILISCDKQRDQTINVYDTQKQSIVKTSLEDYVQAVVAGEISNQAPEESLKAQAILARTYTINFLENEKSKYQGADISTDIQEAQAYNKENINDRIKKAVRDTKGIYLSYNNKPIKAYFHSNSGGKTSFPDEGFNSKDNKPEYLKSVDGVENTKNSNNYQWSYTFTKAEVLDALRNMGQSITTLTSFEKGELGESGRCLTFIIGKKEISATTFRQQIGSTKLKSTLIDSITLNDYGVTFKGRGYGHGVGLSQEGAIILAEQGKSYKEIINYYFKDIKFSKH